MSGNPHVSSDKQKALVTRMEKNGVSEEDLVEKFILGSGSGGQKVNKTASCVYLRHASSGIELKCQQSRSQALNRYLARQELCERLEERTLGVLSKRQQERERIRRQKRKRSRRAKERMLEKKRIQSDKKQCRRTVSHDE